jgi:integrase
MTVQDIVQALHKINYPTGGFKIVCHMCPGKRQQLMSLLSSSFTNQTYVEHFVHNNEWRCELIKELLEKNEPKVEQASAYPEDRMKMYAYESARVLTFVGEHAKGYETCNNDIDPIRWFIYTCTSKMIYDVILEYGRATHYDNSKVKNHHDVHHATYAVSTAIALFKIGLIDKIACKEDALKFVPSMFIGDIHDKRVSAPKDSRRLVTEEEMVAILAVCSPDARDHLMMTILWEVALRGGSLVNLKYFDLVDKHHLPRHKPRVLEKRKKYRDFITSPGLKRILVTFIRYVQIHHPHVKYQDLYIFNRHNLYEPMPYGTFACKVKRIALKAGIESDHIHPHIFRHSLVSRLRKAGNSIEVVSKFLGHDSVDVTMKYYWLDRIEDLVEHMKHPMMGTHHSKAEEEEYEYEQLERARCKIDTAIRIIHEFDAACKAYTDEHPEASVIVETIKRNIPNIGTLMSQIAHTIAESSISSQGF